MNISKCSRWKVKHSFQGSKFLLSSSYVSYLCDMTKTIYRLFQHQGSTLTWKTIGVVTKARFRHQSFHELNLIPWIKYMKRLVSESIWNGYWMAHSFFPPGLAENFALGMGLIHILYFPCADLNEIIIIMYFARSLPRRAWVLEQVYVTCSKWWRGEQFMLVKVAAAKICVVCVFLT